LEAFLVSAGLVALAEMGDKTQLLSFVLAAQLRKPWAIIAGILVATLANHSLAGGAGYLLAESIPRQAMLWIVGLAFVGFGIWTLRPDSLDETPELHKAGAFVTTVIAFFLAEMADKTQFATVALAARFEALWPVVLGTTVGMLVADAPAVWIGAKLATRVPMQKIRLAAAILFIAMGLLTLANPIKELF
jgi:putative Ca2+/H+ antiporter (TMEM165/GDT1 family)